MKLWCRVFGHDMDLRSITIRIDGFARQYECARCGHQVEQYSLGIKPDVPRT